jgi:hypothetical protein
MRKVLRIICSKDSDPCDSGFGGFVESKCPWMAANETLPHGFRETAGLEYSFMTDWFLHGDVIGYGFG